MTIVSRAMRAFPFVVVGIGAALRLRQYASGRSMWIDEALLANNFRRHGVRHMLSEQLDHVQSATVGVILSTETAIRTLGDVDWAYRAVPFGAGLALLLVTWQLARAVTDVHLARTVLVAAAALSPVLIYYSSEFKPYGVDALCTVVVVTVALLHDRWRFGTPALVVCGLVVPWLSLPGVFVLAGCGLVLAVDWVRAGVRRRLVLVGGCWTLAAGLATTWSLVVTDDRDWFQDYWAHGFAPAPWDDPGWYPDRLLALTHVAVNQQGVVPAADLAGWRSPLNVALTAAVVTGLALALRAGPMMRRAVVLLLATAAVTGVASAAQVYPFHSRLLIFLTPVVFVGLAALVDALCTRAPGTWRLAGAVAAVAVLFPLTVSSTARVVDPYDDHDILDILDQVRASEPDATLVATAWNNAALAFYEPGRPGQLPVGYVIPITNDVGAFLGRMASDRPGLTWIVSAHRIEELDEIADRIRPHAPVRTRLHADGAAAYLFDFDDEFADAYLDAAGVVPVSPDPELEAALAATADLPADTLDTVLDRVVGAAPGPVVDGLREIATAMRAVDAACGRDLASWRAGMERVDVSQRAVIDALGQAVPAVLASTTEGRAVGRALVERIVLQTGCAAPERGAPIPESELDDAGVLDLTARVASAAQVIEQRLSGAGQLALFPLYADIDLGWMRTQDQPLDVVVIGTSQAGDGVDVARLEDAVGGRAGNAFLPGGLAEVQQHWLPEVLRLTDPGTIVWPVGALDLLVNCDTTARSEDTRLRLDRLRRAYSVGWFEDVDPVTLVLGPVGPPDPVRGDIPKRSEADAAAIEEQRRSYAALGDGVYCEERASILGRLATEMTDDGRQVLIVGMPSNPRLVDLVAGGRTGVDAALERLVREQLGPAGAEFADLTDVAQDEPGRWRDLIHMSAAGAAAFTDALADELSARGWGG